MKPDEAKAVLERTEKIDNPQNGTKNTSNDMKSVAVSPNLEIVIPSEICQFLNVAQGQKFRVLRDGDRITLTLLKPISSMRGFLKGIDTVVERESDRV